MFGTTAQATASEQEMLALVGAVPNYSFVLQTRALCLRRWAVSALDDLSVFRRCIASMHAVSDQPLPACQSCRVDSSLKARASSTSLRSQVGQTIMMEMGACDKVVRHGQPSCGRMLSVVCHVVFVERPDDVESRNHQDPFGVYPGRPRRASCLDRGWCFKLRSLTTACISAYA
jgi:hypothetical protein